MGCPGHRGIPSKRLVRGRAHFLLQEGPQEDGGRLMGVGLNSEDKDRRISRGPKTRGDSGEALSRAISSNLE